MVFDDPALGLLLLPYTSMTEDVNLFCCDCLGFFVSIFSSVVLVCSLGPKDSSSTKNPSSFFGLFELLSGPKLYSFIPSASGD